MPPSWLDKLKNHCPAVAIIVGAVTLPTWLAGFVIVGAAALIWRRNGRAKDDGKMFLFKAVVSLFPRSLTRKRVLLIFGFSLWIPIGSLLGLLLAITIMPDIVTQPTSYRLTYGGNDPADWVIPLSMMFCVFAIPVLVYFTVKLVSNSSLRWGIRRWHIVIFLSYLTLTAILIAKTSFDVISIPSIFAYLCLGTIFSHIFARAYKERISPLFYKYLEYIYVVAAIGGLLSAAEPLEWAYAKKIAAIEGKISEAESEKASGGCTGNWASDTCLDYENIDSLRDEAKSLAASKPHKVSAFFKIIGYLILTVALNLKILKISGELFCWHRLPAKRPQGLPEEQAGTGLQPSPAHSTAGGRALND